MNETDLYLFPFYAAKSTMSLFLLSLGRWIPIVSIPPFFGSRFIPNPTKIALAISLNLAFFPFIILHLGAPIPFSPVWILLLVKEIFVGICIGFLSSVPFYIAQSAGVLVDNMRGSSVMVAQDPTIQNQASTIGIFLNYLMIALFFSFHGHIILFHAILTSYAAFPPDEWLPRSFFSPESHLYQEMIHLMHMILSTSLKMAAPAIVGSLLAEVFLGIANRLAPNVQIAFLGISVRSILAILLLWLGWSVITRQMGIFSQHWFEKIQSLVN